MSDKKLMNRKNIKIENIIRIIIAILFLNYPIIGFPVVSLIIFISTIFNKNQIPIVGIYCELPEDKYEVINEDKFSKAIKIRGYSLAILVLIGWLFQNYSKNLATLPILFTIIFSIFHLFISNLMLERYYKLEDIKA